MISLINEIVILGFPLSQFAWNLDWIVLAIFAVVFGGAYFLYVWLFGRMKLSETDKQRLVELREQLKTQQGKQRKETVNAEQGAVRRVAKWNFFQRKVWIPVVAFVMVIVMIAVPVWATAGELILATLFPSHKRATNSEAAKLALAQARENVITLEREGIVLVENENNVLPLNPSTQPKINIFGAGAFGMLYGGGGSAVFITNDTWEDEDLYATRLEKALFDEGFEYNTNLYNLAANYYESRKLKITETDYDIQCQLNAFVGNTIKNGHQYIRGTCLPEDNEAPATAYTQTYDGLNGKTLLESAKEFSDIALYCISRSGAESQDLQFSQVKLNTNEKDVITMLRNNFSKVIILLNTCNTVELGLLEDEAPADTAVLWVGHPGLTGVTAIAKTIAGVEERDEEGKIIASYNPSGRLVDTWVKDVGSNPTTLMFGANDKSYKNWGTPYQIYYEGIYVGYRYYVTRALTDNTFDYDEQVLWSFGQGGSYTEFEKHILEWELTDSNEDGANDGVSVQVQVTNIGSVAGKDVVEIYVNAPYTAGRAEKSYYELAAFGKTDVIEPGENFIMTLTFTFEDIASWDSSYNNYIGAYVLEAGTYNVSMRDNVWTKTESAEGDTEFSFELDNEIEYTTDSTTGADVMTRLFEVEFGPGDYPITYLSRSDWAGTLTTTAERMNASEDAMNGYAPYKYSDGQIDISDIKYGENNGLTLRDMKGLDYDDPKWELLLNQMTLAEQCSLVDNGGFQTAKVDSIGKKAGYDDDGPASIGVYTVGHVAGNVIASSWNTECAKLIGESIGRIGASVGLTGWYAPGLNLHRNSMGGRNFEYYSEDPFIAGSMGAWTAIGASEFGVYTYAKHFALNDQETDRTSIQVWANEQSIRELYLKSFETYIKVAQANGVKALGLMSSFNAIGANWSAANSGIMQILRNEWGFHGVVVTDYLNASTMVADRGLSSPVTTSGNDLWLYKNQTNSAQLAVNKYDDMKFYVREACHHILYCCANSNLVWTLEEFQEVGVELKGDDYEAWKGE